jgi:hypothetical protein
LPTIPPKIALFLVAQAKSGWYDCAPARPVRP